MSRKKQAESTTIAAGHIDGLEAAAIVLIYSVTKVFTIFPSRMARAAQTAAWSVPIFSGLLSALWIWALVSVLKANPGKDIITISRDLFGPYVAFTLGIVFYLFTLGIVVTTVGENADAVVTILLPLTPEVFLISITLAVSLYIALKGVEVLGRVSVAIAFVMIGLLVVLSAISANMWQIDSVFPLLGPGVGDLLKTYGVRQAIYGEVLSLGVLAPYLRKSGDTGKVASWTLVLIAVILSLAVLTCQMVFPYPSLNRTVVPLLRVTRIVNLGFLQRFEVVLAPAWLAAGHMEIAIGILVASLAMCSTLNTKRLSMTLVITTVLVFGASRLIPNMATFMVVDFDILRPYSVILLDSWPIALWAASLYRKRSGQGKGGQQSK